MADLLPDIILSLVTYLHRRQKSANSMADEEQSCAAHCSSWLVSTDSDLPMSNLFNMLTLQSVSIKTISLTTVPNALKKYSCYQTVTHTYKSDCDF